MYSDRSWEKLFTTEGRLPEMRLPLKASVDRDDNPTNWLGKVPLICTTLKTGAQGGAVGGRTGCGE